MHKLQVIINKQLFAWILKRKMPRKNTHEKRQTRPFYVTKVTHVHLFSHNFFLILGMKSISVRDQID